MTLKEFKNYIESFPEETLFKNGISKSFSLKECYAEIAFSIVESSMCKSVILKRIKKAYTKTFQDYEGGDYNYNDYTLVNFEKKGSCNYSNGKYTAKMISKLENVEMFNNQKVKLIKLAFC